LETLRFDEQGLIPAIAQDALTGEVRMVAWMNQEALDQTLETRRATFFSRSRQRLWVKGESSGNALHVRHVYLDCDGDTLLLLVDPAGPSCHTGRPTCFFKPLEPDGQAAGASEGGAQPLLGTLEAALAARRNSSGKQSYTKALLDGGPPKIGAKIREEADELARALADESDGRVAAEAADVVYHLLVGLLARGVTWRSVIEVLAGRFGTSGHVEKASRPHPSTGSTEDGTR
jgi:phosphoribosyl-ATP pyrophosphohydrolase/phosphoribosyl-AMP cyclohydrolase